MREKNNLPLRTQYMANLQGGTIDVNMTSSEVVRTRPHIRRFLCRYLVLKIKTKHRPDARHHRKEGKKKKYG